MCETKFKMGMTVECLFCGIGKIVEVKTSGYIFGDFKVEWEKNIDPMWYTQTQGANYLMIIAP